MSHLKTQCPKCQNKLRLASEPREGKRVGCPKCGHRFVPAVAPDDSPVVVELLDDEAAPTAAAPVPQRGLSARPVALAAVGSLLFVGICIAAAVVATQGNGARPVAQQPTQPAAPPTQDDAKEKARRDEEKRRADFDKYMADGNTALADQKYDDAAKAYAEALRLYPQNVDAAKGVLEARTRLASLAKEKADADLKMADFARLMDAGKQAMTAKQYAQAVRSFDNALILLPGNADAVKASDEAKEKLAADTDEKKKLADYDKFMAAGRAALTAGRYADAVKEYTAALVVLPNDPTALEARRAADKRILDEQNDEKRRDSYTQAMKDGEAAMKAKKYKDAFLSYQSAVKLYPDEKEAQQALKQAKDAMNTAVNAFNTYMTQGNTAGQLGRWADAANSYTQASQLFPDNNDAQRALQNAQTMMRTAGSNLQAGQAAYLQYMNAALAAMQIGRWRDAAANYALALTIMPNSLDAVLGLWQAEANLDRERKDRAALVQLLERGRLAYQQGRYADAIRAYKDALLIDPENAAALNGLRQSRYAEHMAAGNNNMRNKQYTAAMRDFEAAMRELPGDSSATQSWQQARSLSMKK